MVAISKFVGVAAGLLIGFTNAHGPPTKRDLLLRDHVASVGARSLGSCSYSARSQALKQRAVQRRAHQVKKLKQKREIKSAGRKNKRTLAELEAWEAVNHNMTSTYDYDMFTSLETVFGANTSCILAPEVTDGPYYVVGEYMRSNVKEEEHSDGVDLFIEAQYIDINTCEPIPDVAVDIWNANATGVYSGISTTGNYAADGVNSTYLRGIQLTDSEGVVSFETIFPGHYSGRAVHTHLLAHTGATVQSNGTISVWDAAVAHIGQLFWPEDLRVEVESTSPYTDNTQDVTTLDEDMWSIIQADSSYDPIPKFVYLGDDITDGLFAWIQIGINGTVDYSDDDYYSIAAYYDTDGGHAESSSFEGGGGSSNASASSSSAAATSTA